MKSKSILLLFFLVFTLSFSILAQSYEVVGGFKGKKAKLVSFSYDEEEGKINGYDYFRDKKCEVYMKEGGRVEDYKAKKQEEVEYRLIDRASLNKNGKFDQDIFLFENENQSTIYFFCDTSTYEKEKSWYVDIFDYSKAKDKISKENIRANIMSISDSLFILTVRNKGDEQNEIHNFVIDFTTKKIIDYFPIQLKKSSEYFHTLFSFRYKNDYIKYEVYNYEELEKEELDKKEISTSKSLKIGKHTTSYFVRNLQTEKETVYTIDQTDYFVGNAHTDLLEDGTIEFTGLYSATPQVDKSKISLIGTYMTNMSNNVEGIFKQVYKDGKKIKDTKIRIDKEVEKLITPFKEIGFASLDWKQGKDKMVFVLTVFPSYNPVLQNTHIKLGICVDVSNNIVWKEAVKVDAGEFNQFLNFNFFKDTQVTDKEKQPYIDTITGTQKITAYKIVCGKIYKKSYKIPTEVEGYEFYSLERYVGKDNNIYALYNRKKEFKLVKLKTSQLTDAIIED